jgi:hypothetical protein
VSLLQSIYGHQTGVYTVTRRPRGTFVDGIYVPAASTTLQVRGVIQPAREIQRVTAGRDMREREQNQYTDDVRIIHTDTEIHTRTRTLDPDHITFEGGDWIVIRVEKWEFGSVTFWMGVITREMDGGA